MHRAATFVAKSIVAQLGKTRVGRAVGRAVAPIAALRLPRGAGLVAALVLVLAGGAYGVTRGGHAPDFAGTLHDVRDAAANLAGFRIATVAISGQHQVTREEVLATAGVTGRTSLLFFDVDEARRKLKANPWIADATVLKLYPDRLQIGITERHPFALWQKDRKLSVISEEGTVLEPYVARRFTRLPFVVGRGAAARAKEFLALLDRYPAIADQVRASILVADRRWNLRLKSGLDVKLPANEPERALERLVELDRDKKILSRDIVEVDLRLPDRVTVRLSDDAAKARENALKAKKAKTKRKGGEA